MAPLLAPPKAAAARQGGYVRSSIESSAAALDTLAGDDPTLWSDTEVHDGLLSLVALSNQLTACASTLVGVFDRRGLAELDGFRATRSWLAAFGRMSPGAATGWLKRSRLLSQLPALAAGASAGAVSAEHLRKVQDLVDHIGVEAVVPFDEILAELAAESTPAALHVVCERIRAYVDPDGPEPDPDASDRRALSLTRSGSLFNLIGKLDAEGAEVVMTAINALVGPPRPDDTRTMAQRRADALVEICRRLLDAGVLPTTGGVRPHLGLLLPPEVLLGHRPDVCDTTTGDAGPAPGHGRDAEEPDACGHDAGGHDAGGHDAGGHDAGGHDAAEHEGRPSAGPRHGGLPDDALDRLGIPRLPGKATGAWRTQLPPEVVQRIACDCDIWRIVLDPTTGVPLNLGRAHRIVPSSLRKALAARDRGCRWPGCTALAQWCDVHHLRPWYYGGKTEPTNCLLLCRAHHGLVHHDRPATHRWRIELDPATGEAYVYRPDGTPYELGPSQPHRGPT